MHEPPGVSPGGRDLHRTRWSGRPAVDGGLACQPGNGRVRTFIPQPTSCDPPRPRWGRGVGLFSGDRCRRRSNADRTTGARYAHCGRESRGRPELCCWDEAELGIGRSTMVGRRWSRSWMARRRRSGPGWFARGPEDMVADEIGLIHPRWRPGTRVDSVIIRRTVNPGR